MEWLEAILKNAKITDGVLDVAGVVTAVRTELPKYFVPSEQYNAKVKEVNAANDTIATLKKDNKDNETLQNTIKNHESTISSLKKEKENMIKGYALSAALKEAGCSDPDYLIYKHGGIEKFTFDEEGKPVDIKQIAETYKESLPHIFQTGQKQQNYNPAGGNGGNGTKNPFAKETWNLTEQGKMFRENPAQAKELAAAAGVTI